MTRSHAAVWCVVAVLGCADGVTLAGGSPRDAGVIRSRQGMDGEGRRDRVPLREPHAQIYFDVKDDKNHAGHWSGELLPNPAQLIASGWTRKRSMEALKAGTTITVTVAPARAGGMVVLIMRILNEKGEELLGGAPPPGAAPRPVP